MDLVLEIFDEHVGLDRVYEALPGNLARDSVWRQALSSYWISWLLATLLYFTFSSIDYAFFFDHRLMKHKQFLPHQVRQEIASAAYSLFVMAALSTPIWLAEVRGYSRLYTDVDEYGWPYLLASIAGFLAFTDTAIYFIHRAFHHPALYPIIHKEHHKWKVPTPYASIAFHPFDGWSQGAFACRNCSSLFSLSLWLYVSDSFFLFIGRILLAASRRPHRDSRRRACRSAAVPRVYFPLSAAAPRVSGALRLCAAVDHLDPRPGLSDSRGALRPCCTSIVYLCVL